MVASVPPTSERTPKRAKSPRRSGAMLPMPPIIMATEPKLAKPQRAYVAMMNERVLKTALPYIC